MRAILLVARFAKGMTIRCVSLRESHPAKPTVTATRDLFRASLDKWGAGSFIVRPHPENFDDMLLFEYLIHQPVLNIDAP